MYQGLWHSNVTNHYTTPSAFEITTSGSNNTPLEFGDFSTDHLEQAIYFPEGEEKALIGLSFDKS
jgi:hypothetical protein